MIYDPEGHGVVPLFGAYEYLMAVILDISSRNWATYESIEMPEHSGTATLGRPACASSRERTTLRRPTRRRASEGCRESFAALASSSLAHRDKTRNGQVHFRSPSVQALTSTLCPHAAISGSLGSFVAFCQAAVGSFVTFSQAAVGSFADFRTTVASFGAFDSSIAPIPQVTPGNGERTIDNGPLRGSFVTISSSSVGSFVAFSWALVGSFVAAYSRTTVGSFVMFSGSSVGSFVTFSRPPSSFLCPSSRGLVRRVSCCDFLLCI